MTQSEDGETPRPEVTGAHQPGHRPPAEGGRSREYTPEQAAALLGISVDELRLWIRLYVIGSGPRVKRAMPHRLRASDLLALRHLARESRAAIPPS